MWRKLGDKPRGGVVAGKGNSARLQRVATTPLIPARHELNLCKISWLSQRYWWIHLSPASWRHVDKYMATKIPEENHDNEGTGPQTYTASYSKKQGSSSYLSRVHGWPDRLQGIHHGVRSFIQGQCCRQSGTGIGFSPSSLVFPASFIPPKFTNSYLVHLSRTLYNIIKL